MVTALYLSRTWEISILPDFCLWLVATCAPVVWWTCTATPRHFLGSTPLTGFTGNAECANTAGSAVDPAPAPSPTPAMPWDPTPSVHMSPVSPLLAIAL